MFKKWICQNRNWVFQNFPFLENDFDALTDYELFCKMVEYAKSLAISNDKFVSELKANLDTMYNEGKFDSFIEKIINLQTTFTFDSVADMKSATNLIDGCYARTSGFYSYNDGGGAFYKIREKQVNETTNEMTVIELSDETLVAELIYNKELNLKQIGAKGDNINSDSSYMQFAINTLSISGGNIILPTSVYLMENGLIIPDNNKLINIIGNNSTLIFKNLSGDAFTCKSINNYIRIMFKDLIIKYEGLGAEVNGINCEKITERILIDNVRIVGFYNNIMLKNCWNLTFNKLVSIEATNDGVNCEDVTNAFNFNSCIFVNNERYNILLTGRGHLLNCCDLSIYKSLAQNRFIGCNGLSISGCYYEESSNALNPFIIQASRGVSITGCYFELASTVENYRLLDVYNSFGVSFIGNEFRSVNTQNELSYLIYLREGSTANISNNDFRNSNHICYITNGQLSVNNNRLDTVTSFITQDNHIYARITGNLQYPSEYSNSILPHKEVVHLTINSVISYGNTSSRPDGYFTGQTYFNNETNHLDIYNGVSWITN